MGRLYRNRKGISMDCSTVFIYTLIDPFSDEIRYIGKSVNPKKRLNKHLSKARKNTKTHKDAWLNSLLKKNSKPILKILFEVPENDWQTTEKSLIEYYSKSEPLLNILPGGEGVPKGTTPWNKGLEGVLKGNSGSFKKGEHRSPLTEIKSRQRLSPKTEFKPNHIPSNCVSISKYDLNGNFIQTYPSYKAAAASVDGWYQFISNCINKTKTNKYKGYLWKTQE